VKEDALVVQIKYCTGQIKCYTEYSVYMFQAYGHYQEASLHLRHSLELKPEFEPALAALKDMESIPDTTIHVYTLLIIICLV
jgi:hypothetical protein